MDSHPVQCFKHIANEFLSSSFFEELFYIKLNILEIARFNGYQTSFEVLDKLNFIELLSFVEDNYKLMDLVIDDVNYERSIHKNLNPYLFSALLYAELKFLKSEEPEINTFALEKNRQIKVLLGLRNECYLFGEYRNEFLLCHYNSFIERSAERFKLSLRSASFMACDYNISFTHPFDERGLSSLAAITLDNAAYYSSTESSTDWLLTVEDFIPHGLDQLLSFDFLHNDPAYYHQQLQLALSRFNSGKTNIGTADLLISNWLSKKCMIYFAYHLDAIMLNSFVSGIADVLSNVFVFNDDARMAVESILKKYALSINPEIFTASGLAFIDFIKPLNGRLEYLEARFPNSVKLLSSCTDKRYLWVSKSIVENFVYRSGAIFTTDDIITNIYGERFKYNILDRFSPKGYFEYFMSDQCKASTEHLLKMARNFLKSYKYKDQAQLISNTCILRFIKSTGDRAVKTSKIEFLLFNKNETIKVLRKNGILGYYSAVSSLELNANHFKNDMSTLTNVSKRALLSQDLDI